MAKELKGQITAGKGNYAIVVSKFNEFISARLLDGALDCLRRHGASDDQVTVVWVPGACEITMAAKKLAMSGKYVAIICLGAVIRGQTCHYDYVCQQVSRGIGQINFYDFEEGVPAFLTLILMPLTYSIAQGLVFGFITFALIKILAGKVKEVDPILIVIAVLCLVSLVI